MKAYIGKFVKHISVWDIANLLSRFGASEITVDKVANYLEKSVIGKAIEKWDHSRKRNVFIKIDNYDAWNADDTLSLIILPLLKKLKEIKHGSGMVDDEDVPEHLRTTSVASYATSQMDMFADKEYDSLVDEMIHKKWDWVLDEMIWAFEQMMVDWEDAYWKVKPEIDFTRNLEDEGENAVEIKWKVKGECDYKGRAAHQDRMQRGFKLFGKYYHNLWD